MREQAQEEIFGPRRLPRARRCPPVGNARRPTAAGGVTGTSPYSSGAPYSTHYLGPGRQDAVTARPGARCSSPPRSAFEMLDDWGDLLGLKGSGSTACRSRRARPRPLGARGHAIAAVDVSGGTPGRGCTATRCTPAADACFFQLALACTHGRRGAGRAGRVRAHPATRPTSARRPPARARTRSSSASSGRRSGKIRAARGRRRPRRRAAHDNCRAAAEGERPYDVRRRQLAASSRARRAPRRGTRCRPGSTATPDRARPASGERLERIFRDMATGWGHFQTANDTFFQGELARAHLGVQAPD